MKTVWVHVNTSKEVGDVDHLKVFANKDAAEKWFEANEPEGVAFEYEVVLERNIAPVCLDENPIDSELLVRLGKIVTLWASVESWTAMLLGTLMGADLGGSSIVTNIVSNSTQVKCIRGLLGVEATAEVISLLDRVDDMRAERNELVHGLWTATDSSAGVAMVNTTNLDRAELIRDRLVTVADLDALVEHTEEWITDYATLGAKFGFPRNKNATQSIFVEQNQQPKD
jgi:hypothetical protein